MVHTRTRYHISTRPRVFITTGPASAQHRRLTRSPWRLHQTAGWGSWYPIQGPAELEAEEIEAVEVRTEPDVNSARGETGGRVFGFAGVSGWFGDVPVLWGGVSVLRRGRREWSVLSY